MEIMEMEMEMIQMMEMVEMEMVGMMEMGMPDEDMDKNGEWEQK